MQRVLRLLVLSAAVAASVAVPVATAGAVEVPRTLADRRPVVAAAVAPGFPIDHLGVVWDVEGHDDGVVAAEVRFRSGGRWSSWQALVPDGAHAEGQWASALAPGHDADAYQVRGVPGEARRPRAVAINTTDGPRVQVATRRAGTAEALTTCRSRADWGADESLRFAADGTEIWPAATYPAQVATVHHTATRNDDPDPAATVRAIYRYHAVDRGWGDIGYQYLVDASGVVYEGRWSGETSVSCLAGGSGSDFAHGADGGVVTAAHVGGANSGNVGVAALGDLRTVEPSDAAVASVEEVLTELAARHGLDPEATVTYVNPVNGSSRTVPTISGHRDWEATECPGDRLYARLPAIRTAVAAALGGSAPSDPAPTAHVASVRQSTTGGRHGTNHLVVDVAVADDGGAPLADATVTVRVDRNGALHTTATATTSTDGVASIRLRNAPRGCYVSTVTAVVASGYEATGLPVSSHQLCK